jgi:hypothetical protein
MKRALLALAVLTWVFAGTSRVQAGTVYSNGPLNGNSLAWLINLGFAVTNSFTLGSDATLTGAEVGLWIFSGDLPDDVSWSIGTTAFGSDRGAGTSAFSNDYQFTNNEGVDIYESGFALGATLSAGTYWLTLQNATTKQGNALGWDQNSGPSMAQNTGMGTIASETFRLFDSAATVPEPSAFFLLGLGLLAPLGAARFRRRSLAS